MFKPTSISQAMGLARLQEDSVEALAKKNKATTGFRNLPSIDKNFHAAPATQHRPIEYNPPIKKLTQKDLDDKKQKVFVMDEMRSIFEGMCVRRNNYSC